MDAALLVVRLLLATVFSLAAVEKLRDRNATAQAVIGLGAPARYARPAARVLPVVELAVAAGLLIETLVVPAATGAMVLLGVFTAAVLNAVRLNRRPDCGCFGNLWSKRVSGWTAIRNVVLAALALFVAVGGAGSSLAVPVEFLIVAGVTSALGLIGRRARKASAPPPQRPRPPRDLHGLPLGAPAPAFELPGSCGTAALSLASLRAAGLPVVLIFLDESCGACRELHPHLHRWQVTLAERVTIGVITTGTDAAGDLCTDHGVENVLVDAAGDPLWGTYEMPGTPSAVAVAAEGSVASAAVRGAEAIEELVRQTIRQGAQTVETWKQLTPVA